MTKRQIKLGAVLTPTGGPGHQKTWLDPEIPGNASVDVNWYIEYARLAESAKFDHVFIVDSQFITPDSPPHYLNRLEPLTLLSALAVATTNIGLIGTLTTSYNDPFNVARRLASLDLISGGRAGWNVVTSGDGGTAGNYGRDEHYDYAARYGRALEHVRVVQGLWDSYEDDAFPRDRATGQFLDPSKVHELNHRGEHFSVVGPLNIARSAQGQPVIFQAGDSEQGRDLGAEIGEGIFTHAASFEAAQAFADELKARAAAKGRNPEHVLIVPGVSIVIADSDEEARELELTYHEANRDFDRDLGELGRPFGWHDFRQYDLDAPFPDVLAYGERSFATQAKAITELASANDYTLRQVVDHLNAPRRSPFVGTALTVADELQRWFDGGAVDGYNVHIAHPVQFRRLLEEVLPILRERGLVRSEYESNTLRGNLGLPVPANRYTANRHTERHTEERAAAERVSAERAAEAEPETQPELLAASV